MNEEPRPSSVAKMSRRLAVLTSFLQQRIALLDQLFKLFVLLRDPVCVPFFILGARECRGLLDQLPDVLAGNGDALFKVRERKRAAGAHHVFSEMCSPRSQALNTIRSARVEPGRWHTCDDGSLPGWLARFPHDQSK